MSEPKAPRASRPDMPGYGIVGENEGTARNSRKARNLSQNRHAVVTPEGAEEAVIVEGEVDEVADAAGLARFGEVYQRKYGMDPLAMKSPVFALRPRVVFGQPEKKFTEAATRRHFDA